LNDQATKHPKKHQNGCNKIRNNSKIRIEIETSEVRKILKIQDVGNSNCDAKYINQFQRAPRQHQYGNISPFIATLIPTKLAYIQVKSTTHEIVN
jgi:hypothetical protein